MKDPMVLQQSCWQPPLFTAHSLTSAKQTCLPGKQHRFHFEWKKMKRLLYISNDAQNCLSFAMNWNLNYILLDHRLHLRYTSDLGYFCKWKKGKDLQFQKIYTLYFNCINHSLCSSAMAIAKRKWNGSLQESNQIKFQEASRFLWTLTVIIQFESLSLCISVNMHLLLLQKASWTCWRVSKYFWVENGWPLNSKLLINYSHIRQFWYHFLFQLCWFYKF